MNITESQTLQLESLDPKLLPELQGWKEKQEQVVKENPFVIIKDHKTYEQAKKSRTSLVTARTTIQNQDKVIASKLKDFRTKVSESSKSLIEITLPHEHKQQEEVKRYESVKESEKLEKERKEEERRQEIKNLIDKFYSFWNEQVSLMNFELIKDVKINFQKAIDQKDNDQFEEFELDFIEKVRILNNKLDDKVSYLTEREEQRKENLRLQKEREAFEAEKAKEEQKRKAEQEISRKQAEKIKKKQEAKEAQLQKERDKIEAEKAEIKRKKEADRKAIEEEEKRKQAAIDAQKLEDEKIRRNEELKPDKEKLINFINSLEFKINPPELIDKQSNKFLNNIIEETNNWRESTLEQLSNIK